MVKHVENVSLRNLNQESTDGVEVIASQRQTKLGEFVLDEKGKPLYVGIGWIYLRKKRGDKKDVSSK